MTNNQTIFEILCTKSEASNFLQIVMNTPKKNLITNKDSEISVFVPINSAFDERSVQILLNDKNSCEDLVNKHFLLETTSLKEYSKIQQITLYNFKEEPVIIKKNEYQNCYQISNIDILTDSNEQPIQLFATASLICFISDIIK